MCGILGVASVVDPASVELLIRMRDTMRHRGPDDAGVWRSPDGAVGLAHRRLPASLCGRLHTLLLDEPARARMGAAGHRLAEERLGVDGAVEAYERALRRAIEQESASGGRATEAGS